MAENNSEKFINFKKIIDSGIILLYNGFVNGDRRLRNLTIWVYNVPLVKGAVTPSSEWDFII